MEREDWIQWRHKFIGGSDAPIVMGVSKYKTPLQLYEVKILPKAPPEESNFIMERGNRVEPKIRALFNLHYEHNMEVALLQSEAFPFMSVSLDGLEGKDICEIKMASKEDHAEVKLGIVPAHYYPQVMHELLVSGAERCWYISYWDPAQRENEIKTEHMEVLEVLPDPAYFKTLIKAETEFWKCVQDRTPPPLSDRDYKQIRGMAKLANKYKQLKLKEDKIADELKAVTDELKVAAQANGHSQCMISGVRVCQQERQGAIDYGAVIAGYEHNMQVMWALLDQEERIAAKLNFKKASDLDAHRKPGSKFWKLDIVKEKEA
jgi:putative phage-type endonuclease